MASRKVYPSLMDWRLDGQLHCSRGSFAAPAEHLHESEAWAFSVKAVKHGYHLHRGNAALLASWPHMMACR
eukprot:4026285-Pleurochrysis_carterae.AAC.4